MGRHSSKQAGGKTIFMLDIEKRISNSNRLKHQQYEKEYTHTGNSALHWIIIGPGGAMRQGFVER